MNVIIKIARYQLRDVFRSNWIVFYALFFLVATDALFRFGGSGDRVVMSLMNVVLIVVPLIAVVLGAMYLYSSREYIELLLTQPIGRSSLFLGLYAGLAIPLCIAFAFGVGVPFLFHVGLTGESGGPVGLLILTGVLLTCVFVAIAFALALRTDDRIRGLGSALGVWIFFSVVYNGLVLLAIQLFSDYPLQHPVIAMTLLNPIDLGRILLLLELDVSALMGFTGAVFVRFFGSGVGVALTLGALLTWLALPLAAGWRAFLGKNF
jgi:Cu-processing system permease protein